MPNWNNLTSKVIQTVEADGILGLGKRGGRYLKKRFGALAKKESEPVFKDVLFIDGCGTVLPHPSRYRVSHQREQLLSYGITSDQVYFADLDLKQIGWYNVFVFFRCPLNETTEKFVKLAKKYQKTVHKKVLKPYINTGFQHFLISYMKLQQVVRLLCHLFCQLLFTVFSNAHFIRLSTLSSILLFHFTQFPFG